jgi:type II secretory pathway pseudopilin PulG
MNTKGFTLIEALLSVALISIVGLVGSRSLLNITRSTAMQTKNAKVSALAEMVFQQYNSYSAQNFNLLQNFNVTNETPAAFFHKADNFGYDNILITTLAEYAANRSTATITLNLSWIQAGVLRSSATFIKTYTESAQRAGGAVDVYVKIPCNGLVDPAEIAAQCPGAQGFSVLAPTFNGSNAPVTTDADGHALLGNVALGAAVQIQFTAPTPSSYTIPVGSPNFVQGFYVVDAWNHYVLTTKIPTSVTAGTLNRMVVTDFIRAGTVTGAVVSDQAVTPVPSLDGLKIEIQKGYVATDAGYSSCASIPPCTVYSKDGTYFFSNVISTTTSIMPEGRIGSDPTIQPSNPVFNWSMIASGGYDSSYSISAAEWQLHTPPQVTKDLHFSVLGWLELTTVLKSDPSQIVPNFPVSCYYENGVPWEQGQPIDMNFPWSASATSDSAGKLKLYNIAYNAGSRDIFYDSTKPPSATENGGSISVWGPARVGAATVFSLPVQSGYELRGYIHDANPNANLALNLGMTGWGLNGGARTNGSGYFSYRGFRPTMDSYDDPLMSDAQVPFPSAINFASTSQMTTVQIAVHTVDRALGTPAPHAGVWVWGGTQPDQYFTSDANGTLNIPTIQVPFFTGLWGNVVCDNTTLVCSLCDSSSSCSAAGPQTFDIDSRSTKVLFNPTQYNALSTGYHYISPQYVATDGTTGIASGNITVTLDLQQVEGNLVDSLGRPVPGMHVLYDSSMGTMAYTDGNGHFGPVWMPVSGRSGAGQFGHILLQIGAQQGYDNTSYTVQLAAQDDPSTPIPVTIPLTGGPANGGGM